MRQPGPAAPTVPDAHEVTDLAISVGRVDATAAGRGGDGPFRVTLFAESHMDRFGYAASSVLLRQARWWRNVTDGMDAGDLEGFAKSVSSSAKEGYRDTGGMRAECSCGAPGGGCGHTEAVRRKAGKELESSHLKGIRLHGLDLEEWIRSPWFQDAELSQRRLAESWGVPRQHRPPAPMRGMPDLSGIPFLREEVLGRMDPSPYGGGFIGRMREWLEAMAEAAPSGADPGAGRGRLAEAGPLEVTIDKGCAMISLFAAPRDGCGPGDLAPPGRGEMLLASVLSEVDPEDAGGLCESDRYWVWLYRYAERLARQGALAPERVRMFRGGHRALWRPATGMSEEVRAVHRRFLESCPLALVQVKGAPGTPEGGLRGSAETQLRQAVDLLVRGIAEMAWAGRGGGTKESPRDGVGASYGWDFIGEKHPEGYDSSYWRRHWHRRMALPATRPQISLRVEPHEELRKQIRVTLGVLDADGNSSTLGEIMGKHPAPAYLDNVVTMLEKFHMVRTYFLRKSSLSDTLDIVHFPELWSNIKDLFLALDVRSELRGGLENIVEPQVTLRMTPRGGATPGRLDMRSLMDFDWKIAMGDRDIGEEELRALHERASRQVERRMRWRDKTERIATLPGDGFFISIDCDLLDRVVEGVVKPGLSHFDLLRAALSGEHSGFRVDMDRDASRLLREKISPRDPPAPPDGLREVLRPYQRTGFEWLAQNADIGFGSILADDMGLGKTLQAIALAAHRTARDPSHKTLVVAPTALLTNWLREIRRFAPQLRAQAYHGASRKLDVAGNDVVVSSYGIAVKDAEKLGGANWGLMVVDEAQNIKNPATGQSKAIKGYRADALVAMTGTPVENRLADCWSIFDFTNRGYLGSARQFGREIATPIEKGRDSSALLRFRKITGPFILRRLKTDRGVIRDLPEKIEGRQYCALSPEQAALYKAVVERLLAEIAEAEGVMDRRGLILKMLTALKQVCDSPALYLRKGKAFPSESGKLELLLEILRETEEAGEKALVFTQYVEMGKLLVKAIRADLGAPPLFLHGGLGRKARDQVVDRFQGDPEARNMVLSLKAGGTGLNLTAATQVIHFDRWWNPAVEAQATDRAFRIGQTRRVQVHLLVTENTLEERIDEMLATKRELSEMTVRSGEKWLTEMDDRQLRELVELARPLG